MFTPATPEEAARRLELQKRESELRSLLDSYGSYLKPRERTVISASVDLNSPDFSEQEVNRLLWLPMHYSNDGKLGKLSGSRLEMTLTFQFSKLLGARRRVARLQADLARIEKDLADRKVEVSKRGAGGGGSGSGRRSEVKEE